MKQYFLRIPLSAEMRAALREQAERHMCDMTRITVSAIAAEIHRLQGIEPVNILCRKFYHSGVDDGLGGVISDADPGL